MISVYYTVTSESPALLDEIGDCGQQKQDFHDGARVADLVAAASEACGLNNYTIRVFNEEDGKKLNRCRLLRNEEKYKLICGKY